MAESYTAPHSMPILGTGDLVRSPSGDNIRKQLNAISQAANTAVTAEGVRAEAAAKGYADTKDTSNRAAWAVADAAKLVEAKAYTDAQVAAAKTAVAWDKGVLAADMNTVQSSGRWTVNDTTLPNRPIAVAGELESAWGSTTGVHRFTTREENPRVYYRRFAAGAFSPWGKGETGVRLDAVEAKNASQDSAIAAAEANAATYTDGKDASNRAAWAAADTVTLAAAKAQTDAGLALDRARLVSLEAVSRKVSNIALDTDGNPYYSPGSTEVHVIPDGDGEPYYITFLQASADTDGTPYF